LAGQKIELSLPAQPGNQRNWRALLPYSAGVLSLCSKTALNGLTRKWLVFGDLPLGLAGTAMYPCLTAFVTQASYCTYPDLEWPTTVPSNASCCHCH
jgi:hypothetical protein